jgi:dTDP-4-amino-4,6-dideoxygalactose transaminase
LADFPASDEADEVALSLPLYPSLTEEDVKLASRILQEELR